MMTKNENQAVLVSIKPKWCELIASGLKTIEVRKTKPKIQTPFKVYIYQTMKPVSVSFSGNGKHISEYDKTLCYNNWSGKVIGEFICDAITTISITVSDPKYHGLLREQPYTCLTDKELLDYLGSGVVGYGWHISDLVIYDKPKKLSEFMKLCVDKYRYCQGCKYGFCKYPEWVETYEDLEGCCFETECLNTIKRPPPSWCYAEEAHDDK